MACALSIQVKRRSPLTHHVNPFSKRPAAPQAADIEMPRPINISTRPTANMYGANPVKSNLVNESGRQLLKQLNVYWQRLTTYLPAFSSIILLFFLQQIYGAAWGGGGNFQNNQPMGEDGWASFIGGKVVQ